MIKINGLFFLFAMALFICQEAFCQIQFKVKLIFPQSLNKEKLSIRYENGKDFKDVKLELRNNEVIIADTFYSKYAAIEIFYPNENDLNQPFYAGFFVSEKPATISFGQNDKGKNPIASYQVENAIEMVNEDYWRIKNFVAEEEKEALDYINNLKNIQVTDSIINIAQAKADKYLNKQTEFFKHCSGSYYYFWYFKKYITVNNIISTDSLLDIYKNAFSDSIRRTFEGDEIMKIIRGRSEKINMLAPNFSVTDINGNSVSLDMFRDSYVLIDFWASWCAPCVKKMPDIKEIRNKYSEKKLKIIFITQDNNFKSFSNAVNKYKIDFGIHLFSTPDLINLYGAQAIPKTFLIDPNGVIIYNNHIEKDFDSDSLILNQLLKEKIK